MKNCAIIDLGTNTFHLLIVKCEGDNFVEIYRERIFVKLAEEGIQTIGKKAYNRGISALVNFSKKIKSHHITDIKAFGTAGLRTASNGQNFRAEVKEKLDIDISIISGDKEADLISKGVGLLIQPTTKNHLIMDIGGGSVEFIYKSNSKIIWSKSFPIGVAVLFNKFQHNNPIPPNEIKTIETYISEKLHILWEIVKQEPIVLIGASGTFDVLAQILETNKIDNYHQITKHQFFDFYNALIVTDKTQRSAIKGMPEDRVELIIVAIILINIIMKKIKIDDIVISHYAMKEGIIYELLNTQNS